MGNQRWFNVFAPTKRKVNSEVQNNHLNKNVYALFNCHTSILAESLHQSSQNLV